MEPYTRSCREVCRNSFEICKEIAPPAYSMPNLVIEQPRESDEKPEEGNEDVAVKVLPEGLHDLV